MNRKAIFALFACMLVPLLAMAQVPAPGMTLYKNGVPVGEQSAARMTQAQSRALSKLKSESHTDVSIKCGNDGRPFLVTGKFGLGVAANKGGVAEDAAVKKFLNAHRELFRMTDAESELKTRSNETDTLGLRTIRFAQQYRGIPVYGGDLVANLDKEGSLTSVNGDYLPGILIDTTPRVSAEEAIAIAQGILGVADDNVHNVLGPELMIYPKDGVYHLAWCLTLVTSKPFAEWKCFVDAREGKIIEKWNDAKYGDVMLTGIGVLGEALSVHGYSQNWTYAYWLDYNPFWPYIPPFWDIYGYSISGYGLVDTSKAMFNPSTGKGYIGTINAGAQDVTSLYQPMYVCARYTTNFAGLSGGSNTTWDFSGHYNAGLVYDYWQSHFGRNSIDNAGMTINVNVNCMFGSDATNAMWSKGVSWFPEGAVFFGRGDWVTALPQSGSLTCVTHELTHGVTNYTSNLEYKYQSGAINEAFSDSFACALENRWQYNAEGCWLAAPGYCRNLEDPHLGYPPDQFSFGSLPGDMSEYQDWPLEKDNGGVHVNMSIISHCFYVLAQSIGVSDAEQIWYKTQTQKCTSTTNFTQLRELALSAACDLGWGVGSGQYNAVMAAFAHVGIGGMDGGGDGGGGSGDGGAYRAGDTLTVTATIPAIAGSIIFDAYSVVIMPTGDVFTVWNNGVTPFKGALVKHVAGFAGGTFTIVNMQLPAGLPAGHYRFIVPLIYTGQNPAQYSGTPSTAVWYAERSVTIQ